MVSGATSTQRSQFSVFSLVFSNIQRYLLKQDALLNSACRPRISSEDSGDVPSYTEDSDDSYSLELDIDPARSGQMNLLEEILDSLNTSAVEQGKLSAAKSLDFFRSTEDLDYKPQVRRRDRRGTRL